MDNVNKLKIGQFSRLCQVSVRTLRHYESIGLLVPIEIDKWTGYRYYSVQQLLKMDAIRNLKDLGFSLDEITELFYLDTHKPSIKALEDKIRSCEAQLAHLQSQHERLQSLLNDQKKQLAMEKIFTTSIPAMIVASYRAVIPSYNDLGKLCVETILPEMLRLNCQCVEPGYCFTFEHCGYKEKNVDIEYCEQVAVKGSDSDILKFKDLPEVPLAVCMNVYGPYDRLYQSYLDLFAYLEKEHYQIVGDPRASYVDGIWNQEDPEKWLTVIQVPVVKQM